MVTLPLDTNGIQQLVAQHITLLSNRLTPTDKCDMKQVRSEDGWLKL
jgi:hypothetical protein